MLKNKDKRLYNIHNNAYYNNILRKKRMKLLYILGIFAISFVLIQVEIALACAIYLLFYFANLQLLGQVLCIVAMFIMGLGHLITTFKSLKHTESKELNLEQILQERQGKHQFLNHPFMLGIAWRLINEWQNIKLVTQLKLKFK